MLVFKVQDANNPVHLIWNLFLGVTFQLNIERERDRASRENNEFTEKSPEEPLTEGIYIVFKCEDVCAYVRVCPLDAELCEHLGEEEQVLSDSEVIKQDVVLRTQSQAAADQSHVLTDVIAIYVGPAAGGRKQSCVDKHKLH